MNIDAVKVESTIMQSEKNSYVIIQLISILIQQCQ